MKTLQIWGMSVLLLAMTACADGGGSGHDPGHGQHDPATVAAGEVQVAQAWSRAIPPNAPVAAGFAVLSNPGGSDDRLVEVRTPAAGRVEIHEVRHEDGVARMRELADGLPLPAGATVELKPGGYHLMFIAPGDGFVAGGRIPATLVFEGAGEREVAFEVRSVDGQAPEAGHAHH